MANFDRDKAIETAGEVYENATDEAVILDAIARIIWYANNNTECPKEKIPTVAELVTWFRENHADKIIGTLPGFEWGRNKYGEWVEAQAEYPLHAFGSNLYLRDLTEYNRGEMKAGRIPPTVRLRPGEKPEAALKDFPSYLPIEALRNQWLQAQKNNLWPEDNPSPIKALVTAWQKKPRTVREASVSVIGNEKGEALGSILPYKVSEFSRNTFSEIPIETATVDGVPVLTQITDAEESIRHALKRKDAATFHKRARWTSIA